MILNYNKGIEQKELAVSTIWHFSKIAEEGGFIEIFANKQLIDNLIKV